MKTKEQLLLEIIGAKNAEITALRCAVAHLQKHQDGYFPSGNLDEARKRVAETQRAWTARVQEEQLNGPAEASNDSHEPRAK